MKKMYNVWYIYYEPKSLSIVYDELFLLAEAAFGIKWQAKESPRDYRCTSGIPLSLPIEKSTTQMLK